MQEATISESAYAAYKVEKEATTSDLVHVMNLIDEMERRESNLLQCEMAVKKAKERLKAISERQIPDFLQDIGMSTLTLNDGTKVEIQSKLQATIMKANRPAAFAFLDENGHSALLRHTLIVNYNADENELADKTFSELKELYGSGSVARDVKVHPSTLKAFVKEQLAAGNELPQDLFTMFEFRTTKVTRINE